MRYRFEIQKGDRLCIRETKPTDDLTEALQRREEMAEELANESGVTSYTCSPVKS